MCSVAEYWARIQRIPLFPDFETDDGNAIICRTHDGSPVRVTRPEALQTDEKREAANSFYEMFYKSTCN
jgi:hypothetical protein